MFKDDCDRRTPEHLNTKGKNVAMKLNNTFIAVKMNEHGELLSFSRCVALYH